MATSNGHQEPAAAADEADMSLQTQQAKETAAGITAENAASEDDFQAAEAQAEVTAERASHLAQVLEEVVEELQERKEEAGQA
jgi:hypothetical protein